MSCEKPRSRFCKQDKLKMRISDIANDVVLLCSKLTLKQRILEHISVTSVLGFTSIMAKRHTNPKHCHNLKMNQQDLGQNSLMMTGGYLDAEKSPCF